MRAPGRAGPSRAAPPLPLTQRPTTASAEPRPQPRGDVTAARQPPREARPRPHVTRGARAAIGPRHVGGGRARAWRRRWMCAARPRGAGGGGRGPNAAQRSAARGLGRAGPGRAAPICPAPPGGGVAPRPAHARRGAAGREAGGAAALPHSLGGPRRAARPRSGTAPGAGGAAPPPRGDAERGTGGRGVRSERSAAAPWRRTAWGGGCRPGAGGARGKRRAETLRAAQRSGAVRGKGRPTPTRPPPLGRSVREERGRILFPAPAGRPRSRVGSAAVGPRSGAPARPRNSVPPPGPGAASLPAPYLEAMPRDRDAPCGPAGVGAAVLRGCVSARVGAGESRSIPSRAVAVGNVGCGVRLRAAGGPPGAVHRGRSHRPRCQPAAARRPSPAGRNRPRPPERRKRRESAALRGAESPRRGAARPGSAVLRGVRGRRCASGLKH